MAYHVSSRQNHGKTLAEQGVDSRRWSRAAAEGSQAMGILGGFLVNGMSQP